MTEVFEIENDIISVSSSESGGEENAMMAAPASTSETAGTSNRSRVSLSPVDKPIAIDMSTRARLSSGDSFTARVCQIYDVVEGDGWEDRKGTDRDLCNWVFLPPSIVKLIKDKVITYRDLLKYGTAGDHYAKDWEGLGQMFLTYGVYHAPNGLNKTPPNPRLQGYTIDQLYDELIIEVEKKKSAVASKTTDSVVVAGSSTPVGKFDSHIIS